MLPLPFLFLAAAADPLSEEFDVLEPLFEPPTVEGADGLVGVGVADVLEVADALGEALSDAADLSLPPHAVMSRLAPSAAVTARAVRRWPFMVMGHSGATSATPPGFLCALAFVSHGDPRQLVLAVALSPPRSKRAMSKDSK